MERRRYRGASDLFEPADAGEFGWWRTDGRYRRQRHPDRHGRRGRHQRRWIGPMAAGRSQPHRQRQLRAACRGCQSAKLGLLGNDVAGLEPDQQHAAGDDARHRADHLRLQWRHRNQRQLLARSRRGGHRRQQCADRTGRDRSHRGRDVPGAVRPCQPHLGLERLVRRAVERHGGRELQQYRHGDGALQRAGDGSRRHQPAQLPWHRQPRRRRRLPRQCDPDACGSRPKLGGRQRRPVRSRRQRSRPGRCRRRCHLRRQRQRHAQRQWRQRHHQRRCRH